jgi:peroxiredoxin
LRVPFTCLADPQRSAYRAFALRRGGPAELFGPRVLLRYAQAALKGHLGGVPAGDTRLLPGTFIIDRHGRVRYARYARHAGDHPPVEELVAALRQITSDDRGQDATG